MGQKLRVTVWNEFRHEKESERIRSVYPQGIHTAIGEGLGATWKSPTPRSTIRSTVCPRSD